MQPIYTADCLTHPSSSHPSNISKQQPSKQQKSQESTWLNIMIINSIFDWKAV
jgi:hypothetical protein